MSGLVVRVGGESGVTYTCIAQCIELVTGTVTRYDTMRYI